MQRRKVDNRIRVLIENGVAERQRTLFVVVGDRGKDQVTGALGITSTTAGLGYPGRGFFLCDKNTYFKII